MLFEDLRGAIASVPLCELPAVSVGLWKAFNAGAITEGEAEALSGLIEARQAIPAPSPAKPRRVGPRPITSESLGRRRRWAASGYMPPPIAARFTPAETAALAVIAHEIGRRGDCRLPLDHIAAVAGVARSSVKRALREARALGLITIEERRLSRWRSETNVVRVVDRAWSAWLRTRAGSTRPAAVAGGGGQSRSTTNTQVLHKAPKRRFKVKNAAERQNRSRPEICREARG